jgi:23S rRNA (cytidine1920-2'-O)/16S rRNA (cytidine1409-2'-O)-methyltransferase
MKSGNKVRADQLLVSRALVRSRAEGQARILAGEVFLGEVRVEKAGQLFAEDVALVVVPRRRFVSRGGEKLEHALVTFGLDVTGLRCVDVGASTGGFTDCLLQRGAATVVALDVGAGQLDPKLLADPRVRSIEGVNARGLGADAVGGPADLVVVDASFIGLDKLASALAAFTRPGGQLVALVKPQFEAGREAVKQGRGVIRDEPVRLAAIARARDALIAAGFDVIAETDSAVHGPKGNIEHFVWATRIVAERSAP